MDDLKRQLDRLETKIDDQNEHLANIDVTLATQSTQLREHMRRTSLLEQEVRPIRKHVAMVSGALKFLGIVASILAITAALHELMK